MAQLLAVAAMDHFLQYTIIIPQITVILTFIQGLITPGNWVFIVDQFETKLENNSIHKLHISIFSFKFHHKLSLADPDILDRTNVR